MKTTINFNQFKEGFRFAGREHNFSDAGLATLFAYFEELESDAGYDIEFDPIGICCQFVEYPSFEAIQEDYSVSDMKELEYNTTVIPIEESDNVIGYIVEVY